MSESLMAVVVGTWGLLAQLPDECVQVHAKSAAKNKSSSKASAWLVTSALAGAHCGGILVVKLHP